MKNYPDPMDVVSRHGADAVRMYLCNSPVVRAEPLLFKEADVKRVVGNVFLPYYNAYRFLVQEVTRYEQSTLSVFVPSLGGASSDNVLDKWIYSCCQSALKFLRGELEAYRLYTVVDEIIKFLDNLTNWYVRLNRDRMRGSGEALVALSVLYEVLLNLTVMLAPVTPFITEMVYQNLSKALPSEHPLKAASVHFVMIPEPGVCGGEGLEKDVQWMQRVVELCRGARDRRKVPVKTPLLKLKVISSEAAVLNSIQQLESYIKAEVNVESVEVSGDTSGVKTSAAANFK